MVCSAAYFDNPAVLARRRLTLVSGVFGAVLAAIHRFDPLSFITMGQTVIRACGVLLILAKGRGNSGRGPGHSLIALAAWELTVLLLVGLATLPCAMKNFARVACAQADPICGSCA